MQIGTGEDSTPGVVYASNKGYRVEERGSLACVGDVLVYRSPEVAPAAFVVIGTDYLNEITTVELPEPDLLPPDFKKEEKEDEDEAASTSQTNNNNAYGFNGFGGAYGNNRRPVMLNDTGGTDAAATIARTSDPSGGENKPEERFTPIISDGYTLHAIVPDSADKTLAEAVVRSFDVHSDYEATGASRADQAEAGDQGGEAGAGVGGGDDDDVDGDDEVGGLVSLICES